MAHAKLTIANPAGIKAALDTFFTATLPVADRWTKIDTDLPGGEAGSIYTQVGSGSVDFPLGVVITYKANDNFLKITTGHIVDTGGGTGSVINRFVNPSFQAATASVPDTWVLTVADPDFTFLQGDGYMDGFGARARNYSGGDEAIYQETAALAATTDYVLSIFMKGTPTSLALVTFFFQDALASPPVDPTGGNIIVADDVVEVEDGWCRVSVEVTSTGANEYYAGIVIPDGVFYDMDAFQLEAASLVPSAYTEHTAANDVVGVVLRKSAGVYKVFFTKDAATFGASDVICSISADLNSISLVLGNDTTGDKMYNAAFYGRLVTPRGDPADASNSNAADLYGIAIGVSSHDSIEGSMRVLRDSFGRYWSDYTVTDFQIGAHTFWGGGPLSRFDIWGTPDKFLHQYESMFRRDVYWREHVKYIALASPQEGFRGVLPRLYNMTIIAAVEADFDEVFVTPEHTFYDGTADSLGTGTSLNDSTVNFSTMGVVVGDVAYHKKSSTYAKISAVAATELTTSDLGGGLVWGSGDEYVIYRGIMFDVFQVSFDIGTLIKATAAGAADNDFTYNQFSPSFGFRSKPVRRQAVVLEQS